jgi:hypothetical protein
MYPNELLDFRLFAERADYARVTSGGISGMPRCEAREDGVVLLHHKIRKAAAWCAQQQKQFTGPQQNIQEPAALQIVNVVAVQGDFEGPLRAFLDKRPGPSKVEGNPSFGLPAGINALQILVTELDKMADAETLLRQGSHTWPFAEIHGTDSIFSKLRHGPDPILSLPFAVSNTI